MKKIYNTLYQKFIKYTDNFCIGNDDKAKNCELKRTHSLRVADIAYDLGTKLSLSENECYILKIAGLYHDIGRFEQVKKYNTFSDSKSEDHGNLGRKVIEENHFLDGLDKNKVNLILVCVELHNKLSIPDNLDNETKKFLKIIRDADKIDIFDLSLEYYESVKKDPDSAISLDLPDTEDVNDAVIDDIKSHNMVKMENLSTVNDFKLLQGAWVFDLNFKETIEVFEKRNYLKRLSATLPSESKVTECFNIFDNYIRNFM